MSTGKLTREKIAAAALAIADAEGFEAVSMRRVAQELKAGTMSLYHYVKTKDDLMAVMDDALMGESLLPSLPKGWQRAVTAIAMRTYAVFVRHPWAVVSMLSAPPGINAMRHMEQCLEALSEAPLTNRQKIALLATVDDFVFGHALRQSATSVAPNPQLAFDDFPRLAKAFANGPVPAMKNRFERGLRVLIAGCERSCHIMQACELARSSRGCYSSPEPRRRKPPAVGT